jgi:hypothetical protein
MVSAMTMKIQRTVPLIVTVETASVTSLKPLTLAPKIVAAVAAMGTVQVRRVLVVKPVILAQRIAASVIPPSAETATVTLASVIAAPVIATVGSVHRATAAIALGIVIQVSVTQNPFPVFLTA